MKLKVRILERPKLRTRQSSDVGGCIMITGIHGGESNTIYNPVYGQLTGGES